MDKPSVPRDHKSLKRQLVIALIILFLVAGMFLLLKNAWNMRPIAKHSVGNFEVKIVGSISWDKYCQPRKIIIKDGESGKKISYVISSDYSSPCVDGSQWIDFADYNNDGHDDIRFHNDPANDGFFDRYTYFYYDADNNTFATR